MSKESKGWKGQGMHPMEISEVSTTMARRIAGRVAAVMHHATGTPLSDEEGRRIGYLAAAFAREVVEVQNELRIQAQDLSERIEAIETYADQSDGRLRELEESFDHLAACTPGEAPILDRKLAAPPEGGAGQGALNLSFEEGQPEGQPGNPPYNPRGQETGCEGELGYNPRGEETGCGG